ncbi:MULTISPECIES: protein translocase subunit SecD [Trueperella]|uniref:Protein translocase subunit SecD n=1 Tax=Trueperella bernardiae TaxID=59561 RepID=A0A0W1KLM5_9ACTO|nr:MULTISPECIES: protein translocase subunit SecD [Trueperella]KTF04949.1 Protein translocase subunit SecD [Trueperella bernardiae]MCM3906551.1 protein translocase subunit SecD [Trueperella bernardiae]MDK8601054.1 protein translocase subunit SecD [Trueperella bernardiae]MDV6238290.1 protein translocase subunit SecD [Trueperella bernardiae]
MSSSHLEDPTPKPWRRLTVLFILVLALVGSLIAGSLSGDKTRFTPDLALDLEGGTQIILTPVTTDGSEVTASDIREAINVIRQRVDATGVAEAEITAQGGSNIIVALPGTPSKETLDLVRTSAVLRMRPVLSILNPAPMDAQSVVAALGENAGDLDPATMDAAAVDEAIRKLADVDGDGELSAEPAQTPENASDTNWITEQVMYDAYTLDCTVPDSRPAEKTDSPDTAIVACEPDTTTKYILGPSELDGTQLDSASSSPATNQQGQPTGGWAVNMSFNSEGGKIFGDVTTRLSELKEPRNSFASVLDGRVISSARVSYPITGGQAQITGRFTADEAGALANQLKFGSLPLQFNVQSEEQISATLGAEQLSSGLIAGLVGLVLIVIYMIWQYHALGVVAIGSILTSTGLSYLIISLLSWTMGYRLSMAGVLGIIISIGVTADSFIVYFERIRDEIRDGRSVASAVQHGWNRAQRTIIISDLVNLTASVVLFLLTVGSVRGFAFTLGVTTVLDLVVVMMFTYPIMTLISRTAFFGKGKRGSGMDTKKLESTPRYRGRTVPERKQNKPKDAMVAADGAVIHDYEMPDARFTGESLAQQRARQRREARRKEGDQ